MALNARKYTNSGKSLYRVFITPNDSQLVEADNAAMAAIESGAKQVYRIQRENESMLENMPFELLEPLEEPVMTCTEHKKDSHQPFIKILAEHIHPHQEDEFVEIALSEMHAAGLDKDEAAVLAKQ